MSIISGKMRIDFRIKFKVNRSKFLSLFRSILILINYLFEYSSSNIQVSNKSNLSRLYVYSLYSFIYMFDIKKF